MTDAPKAKARPAGLWERLPGPFERYIGPLCLVGGAAVVAWVAVGIAHDGLDRHLVGTVFLGLPALIAACVGVGWLFYVFEGTWMVFPCPGCGVVKTDAFYKGREPRCDACGVYARIAGDDVVEEDPEALRDYPYYRIDGSKVQLPLAFPPLCAVCGKPSTRSAGIRHFDTRPPTTAKEGNAFLELLHLYASDNTGIDGTGRTTFGRENDNDRPAFRTNSAFQGLSYPLCGRDHGRHGRIAVTDFEGNLGFCSYRYYRAFLDANFLTQPGGSRQIGGS